MRATINMLSPRRKLSALFYYYSRRKAILLLIWTFSILSFVLMLFKCKNLISLNSPNGEGEKDMIISSRGNEINLVNNSQKCLNDDRDDAIDNQVGVNSIWTRISSSVYVYSAHLDTRVSSPRTNSNSHFLKTNNLTLIRIIGIKRVPSMRSIIKESPLKWLRIKDETYFGNEYFCKIFIMSKYKEMYSFQGEILTFKIVEEGIKQFASTYFNCYINSSALGESSESKKWLLYVAIYPINVSDYPDKLIQVETFDNARSSSTKNNNIVVVSQFPLTLTTTPTAEKASVVRTRTLSICIRPLFGPMDQLIKLVQFVSYYYSMGVTTFNFYDLSISPRVRKYLTDLRKLRGINVKLQKWNIPTGNTSELWDFGTIAALNNCLYRNMGSNHVIFVDIDEFIVPQLDKHDSLHDLINYYENTYPNFHQLLIRNSFFCTEFCPERKLNYSTHINSITDYTMLPISTCNIRTKRVWNVKLRSKFIVKPRSVIAVGHHLVNIYFEQGDKRLIRSVEAMKDIAILNHYRECKSISAQKHSILNRMTVLDNKIIRFVKNMKRIIPSFDV